MKEKIKLLANNKHIFVILIIILILLIGTAGTYAWFTWSNPSNTKLSITIGDLDIVFGTGNDINITNLSPVFYPTEGAKTSFTIKKNNTSISSIAYNISLDITTISDELKSASLKWAVTNKDTSTVLAGGNFSNASNGTSINLYDAALTGTTASYDFYIYIDANIENSSSMMNKTLTGTINIEASKEETLGTYITNLYTNATKTSVTNFNTSYDYANLYTSKGGLMDDHGENIRYYGEDPDNYIYFNCFDYSNQTDTTCEKWRIIGVFNGKVKIMRSSIIGTYSWDNKTTSTGAETNYGKNDWSTARLMKLLNPSDYYTIDTNDNGYGESLYYNGQSGSCFRDQNNGTASCNFTSSGLKNDTTRNMISTEVYYTRGNNSSSVYSLNLYGFERYSGSVFFGREISWLGKIAIPYPSDYGYASDFRYCTVSLTEYSNNTKCTSTNWMKNIITNNGSSHGWLLTHYPNNPRYAWHVLQNGNAIPTADVYNMYGITPVLSLNSTLGVQSGTTGESTNPYKLSV